jgi:hypothetical protein
MRTRYVERWTVLKNVTIDWMKRHFTSRYCFFSLPQLRVLKYTESFFATAHTRCLNLLHNCCHYDVESITQESARNSLYQDIHVRTTSAFALADALPVLSGGYRCICRWCSCHHQISAECAWRLEELSPWPWTLLDYLLTIMLCENLINRNGKRTFDVEGAAGPRVARR